MISIEGLTVEFGGFTLFDDISFVVNKKDRIALVGKNGAGKSTMLKIFAGQQSPTSGSISIPKEVTIGYLPQQMQLVDHHTVREEAELAFAHIHEMTAEIERLNNQLAERTDYESESYQKLIDRMPYLTEHFQMMGGNNYQAELERTLVGLGFQRSDFDRPTAEFSGGWRMRIELAKLLLQQPDVLLLDEPTNHLDIESIQWLENFIATRANAVILVSHDRAFINNTTFRTIEIELGKIYDYKVKYNEYVQLRKERREQQLRAYENQQKKLADTEAFIERFRYKATKAVQVQSRIKQLEKVERIEVDEVDTAMLNLKFPPAPRSGSYPVICEEVAKRYGDHLIFDHVTFTIHRGDKVAFVGKNGEGKSTLVKCIMGEINDYTGKLQLGHNVKIGYFAQNQAQLLNENLTVFETIDYVAQGDMRLKIRDLLGAFMFGGEASDKKVKVLSGGERTRLAMIRLLLEPVNLLILDEPTNHLDMRSKDVLKDAIKAFDGTVILVSHDREFLDGLVDKVYEFGNQRVVEHLGGIYDFLERKKMESLAELERSAKPTTTSSTATEAPVSQNKLSYEARKEQSKAIKKAEKAVSDAEARIAALEKEIAEIETRLATPEGAADTSLYTDYAARKQALSDTMDEWTERQMELEELIAAQG
ncbi:MAG: ABC-F family ATP-binding cassette domain-containing protein [Parabacteroides sp.]